MRAMSGWNIRARVGDRSFEVLLTVGGEGPDGVEDEENIMLGGAPQRERGAVYLTIRGTSDEMTLTLDAGIAEEIGDTLRQAARGLRSQFSSPSAN